MAYEQQSSSSRGDRSSGSAINNSTIISPNEWSNELSSNLLPKRDVNRLVLDFLISGMSYKAFRIIELFAKEVLFFRIIV